MIYKCASSSGGTIAEANNRGASVVEYGATYGDADARGEVSWGA
jgi:LmbE family N-acetylglucosaminyl deacetylase